MFIFYHLYVKLAICTSDKRKALPVEAGKATKKIFISGPVRF